MSVSITPHIVINPASAGGHTARLQEKMLDVIERHIGKKYSLCITKRPMDAMRSAYEAIRHGCTQVLVAGGDGTMNEVINGILQNGHDAARNCAVGIIRSGSGEGLARSLGIEGPLEEQIRIGLHGDTKAIDVGKISCVNSYGRLSRTYFVNECQVGIGAEVVRKTTSGLKRAGGFIAYGLRTLSLILGYRSTGVTIAVDGIYRVTQQTLGVTIGNGAITAGGMRLTPYAHLSDGLLDILVIDGQSVPERLRSFLRVYSGRHVNTPSFTYIKAVSLELTSETPTSIAADGELLGYLPCAIEVIPSVLNIRWNGKTSGGNSWNEQ